MNKKRILSIFAIIAVTLTLALVGGNWNTTYAKEKTKTVPHHKPHPPHPPHPGDEVCGPSSIPVGPTKEGKVGCLPWEGFIPVGASCKDGVVVVWELPISGPDANPPPYWWKMIHYSDAFEIHYYVNGQKADTPSCEIHDVRFYLDSWQRQTYDKTPDMEQIHYLNMETQKWELCPTTLDTTIGSHGILVCHMTDWGYYALGHPSASNQ